MGLLCVARATAGIVVIMGITLGFAFACPRRLQRMIQSCAGTAPKRGAMEVLITLMCSLFLACTYACWTLGVLCVARVTAGVGVIVGIAFGFAFD